MATKTWSGADYYDTANSDYQKKAKKDLAQQTADTTASYGSQLQQAYIQRMKDQKTLNNNLASSGIRGGATETANLNLINQYNSNRNEIYSNQASALKDLNTNYNDNIFNYAQQMATAKAEYKQNNLATYYQSLYNKNYSIKKLKKALNKTTSNEEASAINQRIAYLREHKKGY